MLKKAGIKPALGVLTEYRDPIFLKRSHMISFGSSEKGEYTPLNKTDLYNELNLSQSLAECKNGSITFLRANATKRRG